jgi:hypothetical protein
MAKLVQCGCGKHYIRIGSKTNVEKDNRLWDRKCIELIDECCMCDEPLGNSFAVVDNKCYHHFCLYDIGGEG